MVGMMGPVAGTFEELTQTVKRLAAPGQTVLLVDREPDTQEALRYLLEAEGYAVLVTSTGGEALALLEQVAAPLLVILDAALALQSTGFVEALQAHPSLPDFPVVLMGREGAGASKAWKGARVAASLERPVPRAGSLWLLDEPRRG